MLKIIKERKKQQLQLNNINYGKSIKTITFYISDHGFGHASRNIPIIRYILKKYDNIRVIIKTGEAQGEFIRDLVGDFNGRASYFFEPMDIGLVLIKNCLDIDVKCLEIKVKDYIDTFEERISKENEFLHYNNIDLIISDIVPWIFKSSKKLKISSILISNFTWVEIYSEHLSEDIVNKYRECYSLADKALFYKLYMEEMKDYIVNYEEVSLCSRDFELEKADKIKRKFKRKIVYLSVGRSVQLNELLDTSGLNYDFIVTDGLNIKGDNVMYLSKETVNTQDYIMASDFIITKAGWGTVSEALLGKKKIAVLSRDKVAEDRNTIRKLVDNGLAIESNFDLEKILERLESFIPRYDKYDFKNDYKKIGDIINEKEQ